MRLLKVELLLDLNEIVEPSDINAVMNAVFENNSHLAKLIVCDSQLVKEAEDGNVLRNSTQGN